MKRKQIVLPLWGCALGYLMFALAEHGMAAPPTMKPRSAAVPADSPFVLLSLNAVANGQQPVTFPSSQIEVDGIPFNLVTNPSANHLFVKTAGWSDWANETYPGYLAPYDNKPVPPDPRRFLLQLPVGDYSHAWLLAATDPDTNLSDVVTLRIGLIGHVQRVVYHDFSVKVPRRGDKSPGVVNIDDNLFLVRVPVGKVLAQDFKDVKVLDLDITKELRLAMPRPDPYRYQFRPLGLDSGVRIFGLTFERAPVSMEVQGTEPGNVFNQPKEPSFTIRLSRIGSSSAQEWTVDAKATDWNGQVGASVSKKIALKPQDTEQTIPITLPVKNRGYHELIVTVSNRDGMVLTRQTTFALLPPDARKYRHEAPFGTWDFSGGHYGPKDPDLVGPLYVKAGLRYGMFHYDQAVMQKYGVLQGNDATTADTNGASVVANAKHYQEHPELPKPPRYMIFHENSLGGPHMMRPPDVFTGRQYKFDAEEQKAFQLHWQMAEVGSRAIRQHFPQTVIYFGNGVPQLLEEFCRNKVPKEWFDARGNESATLMRPPETQPLDYVANNAGLWMERQILDHYGYKDVPVYQCYEMCYPNTNPGNLKPRTQAAYIVRHFLHSLAWGVPVIRAGMIADIGNSYYFGNWGASGLCYGLPDVRPKPSYVAVATMTSALDGAKFTRVLPMQSPSVFAVEFQKKDKSYVTCLWTLRGSRKVSIQAPVGSAVLTDLMGNETKLAFKKDKVEIELVPEPSFLATAKPINSLTAGIAKLEGRTLNKPFLVSSLDKLSDWKVETGRSVELETYSFVYPRRKGEFGYREIAAFEGEHNTLEVKPKLPVEGSVYFPMYGVLAHTKGVVIPGEPTEIGVMVNGNGGWGRVIFELEDASGQRWISIGAEQAGTPPAWLKEVIGPAETAKLKGMGINDWNTDDVWGRTSINFEGWRYVKMPLPGNYPGEGYHWPYSGQWRHSGDGKVKYPLKFTKLVITLPEKILYMKDYLSVPRQEIYLKDLMVTYESPEKAFVGE